MRKLILSCLACLALTLLVFAPSASAQSAENCKWRSNAIFTPGLSTSFQAFTYKFSGQLNECQSSERLTGPGDGSANLEAGELEEGKTVENSITHELDFVTYAMPMPSGSGVCGANTTSGTALASWPNGDFTVFSYSTTGEVLSGEVVPSMTLTALNAQPGDPTTVTYTTNRFAGYALHGQLEIPPREQTACTTAAGLTTSELDGKVVFTHS